MLVVVGLYLIFRPAPRPDPRAAPQRGGHREVEAGRIAGIADAAAGVLVGRRGAVGRRGHLQRCPGFQEVRGQERLDHADLDVDDPGDVLPRRGVPGQPAAPVPGGERRQRPGPAGRARLRQPWGVVLDADDRHVLRADPRRQHRLRRLSPAVLAHRQRRLPAPPVLQPRRLRRSATACCSSPSSPAC